MRKLICCLLFIGFITMGVGCKLTMKIGKIYDPYYQERTDAIQDLVKQKTVEVKDMLDKIFRIGEYKWDNVKIVKILIYFVRGGLLLLVCFM